MNTFDTIVRHIKTSCNIVAPKTALSYSSDRLKYTALWDTGASMTAISEQIAKGLPNEPIGKIPINTIIGAVERNIYEVDIILPGGIAIPKMQVYDGAIAGADILIGRDIISLGSFAISNHNLRTVFSFEIPSEYAIDFTKKLDETNPEPKKSWMQRILNR